jgi:hypothetical protein
MPRAGTECPKIPEKNIRSYQFLLRLKTVADCAGTKRELKLSPFLINIVLYDEDVWEIGGIAPPFLTSTLGGDGQLHAPATLSPVPIG